MIKRLFDMAVAGAGLIGLSPFLLLVALLIKLSSTGPVLFRQERMGRGFRPFDIVKFRTMVPDAEKLGGTLTAGTDPRVTGIGRLLRRTKLDELPQLVNVLKGEMSLVGPRPEVPRYVELFREDYNELLTVRPGMTDPASIKYRSESEILGGEGDPEEIYVADVLPDKIALAKDYVRRASFRADLELIVRTLLSLSR